MFTISYNLEKLVEKAVNAFVARQKAAAILDLTHTIRDTSDPSTLAAARNARAKLCTEIE